MTHPPQRRTILLVDDNRDILTSLSRIIERAGYSTVSACTIREALDREDWHRYLAVILDRQLPDGWIDEYLSRFREQDPDMAIVIITGYSDLNGTVAALREQAQDYLIKPVNPDLLLSRLAQIAENQAARESVRRLEQEVIRAADEEKRRIAMEIHDGLGSKLGGIAMMCQGLERTLKIVGREEEAQRAREIDTLVRETISEARKLSRGLHSVHADPQGLSDALRNLAEQVRGTWNVDCGFDCPTRFVLNEPNVANHLFRIAQEAVTNAIRHGASTRVDIALEEGDGEITLRILDNGRGFDPVKTRGKGMGLHSMDYRARAVGGALSIQTREDSAGMAVVCRIPRPDGADPAGGEVQAPGAVA